jgi:hypothetical protein
MNDIMSIGDGVEVDGQEYQVASPGSGPERDMPDTQVIEGDEYPVVYDEDCDRLVNETGCVEGIVCCNCDTPMLYDDTDRPFGHDYIKCSGCGIIIDIKSQIP